MKCCSNCSHLSGMNISQTGRHCGASMRSESPVSDFIVFNPDMFYCSMFTVMKEISSLKLSTIIPKEGHGRAKAAPAD
jgi:hypothetical protein